MVPHFVLKVRGIKIFHEKIAKLADLLPVFFEEAFWICPFLGECNSVQGADSIEDRGVILSIRLHKGGNVFIALVIKHERRMLCQFFVLVIFACGCLQVRIEYIPFRIFHQTGGIPDLLFEEIRLFSAPEKSNDKESSGEFPDKKHRRELAVPVELFCDEPYISIAPQHVRFHQLIFFFVEADIAEIVPVGIVFFVELRRDPLSNLISLLVFSVYPFVAFPCVDVFGPGFDDIH